MIFKILLELIKDILLIDLILSFISSDFNNLMISKLKKQNKLIKKRNEKLNTNYSLEDLFDEKEG